MSNKGYTLAKPIIKDHGICCSVALPLVTVARSIFIEFHFHFPFFTIWSAHNERPVEKSSRETANESQQDRGQYRFARRSI